MKDLTTTGGRRDISELLLSLSLSDTIWSKLINNVLTEHEQFRNTNMPQYHLRC